MDETEIERVREIPDPLERAKAAAAAQTGLKAMEVEFGRIRREALDDLKRAGVSQAQVARQLGVTSARLSQLMKSGPGPERALLDPKATLHTSVTLAVVRKTENTRNRHAVMNSTFDAALKLQALLSSMDLTTVTETVPEGGDIDLNRDHLIVMIGPRISPLIGQAISADPAIKWRRDEGGHWFLTDVTAGVEYHSDFDTDDHSANVPLTCYAHIGRIPRPDRQGSFLYLGGEHAPGTAGAVDVLCRDISTLWANAHRNLWSAVVKTTASADGDLVSAELVTPIYTHGKR